MRCVCVSCGSLADAFEFFEEGWACSKCVLSAEKIVKLYSINGQTFTKKLIDSTVEGRDELGRAKVRSITARKGRATQ